MDIAEVAAYARLGSSAIGVIATALLVWQTLKYRDMTREYSELMREARHLCKKARADAAQADLLKKMIEKKEGGRDKVKLPQMHRARKYGAEYIRKPMRVAQVIPGTRNEECTKLYADGVSFEWESVISVEAELDGELIKVIEKSE